jgi:glycosyltransferase involved in cell wall biosynthesis
MTAMSRAGRERGLGRNATACLDACAALGHTVEELRLRDRTGRTAELRDLADRSIRARRREADVFHATHPGVWGATGIPTVTSILDVIPIDLASDYGRSGVKTKLLLRLAARSDAVLTLSEFSAGRIVERLGVERERIIVAPLYPTPAFERARQARGERAEPYVLTVMDLATPDPRKRAGWIAPIAARLGAAGLALKVIGAGTETSGAQIGSAQGLGRLTDEEMAKLHAEAACFVYFSAYEGQGLPPLEAMAGGTPVVAVANTAVAEVVGDGGILVEERASSWEAGLREGGDSRAVREEIVDACVELARDPALAAATAERGQERASRYSAERFRKGVDRAYEIAMSAT